MDQRIVGGEILEQRRHDQGPVVVHHAKTDPPVGAVRAHPADRLGVEAENPAGITEQPFAGRTEVDAGGAAVKQLGLQPFFQPLHLHADGGLGPVQRRCRAGEGAMVRHRDKGLQEIRVQGAHNDM